MPLADDHHRIADRLGREPTPTEAALFENLWSEHCAYRSSRRLLGAFESESPAVVVGPGDDAAVVALPAGDENEDEGNETGEDEAGTETYITLGIESHNHPSFVDPYDGAATGVGGIVRDTLSMGAYPIALTDSLYFGTFEREHTRYLLDGVVGGIADYGNAIGVPTVGGSLAFHPGYEGNPLVNVACVGVLSSDRLVTADAKRAGNELVLVGNATGRDGLGGASFASEGLGEDAASEDRPAVQVGDPYTEKLLIEANEHLVHEGLIEAARDLGAAGLGGASAELVAKGGFGARIDLGSVHQREPNMNPTEILLAESQERMCYEVEPETVERVREVAERYELGCSTVGEVTDGNYTCVFEGETVVDVPAAFLADGAPAYDLPADPPTESARDLPNPDLETAFCDLVASPNTASREWVYRQYDHEVGLRTVRGPGDDSAVLGIDETATDTADGIGLALSAGAEPNWTAAAPEAGARAVALENATNLAATGARPLAAVDCLNGGNPENPETYGGFSGVVAGLAGMCDDLGVPVVGGNVSLYNDSVAGPVPPTPTLAMVATTAGYEIPPTELAGTGELVLVGDRVLAGHTAGLGGSEYLARFGGTDGFPGLPARPRAFIDALSGVANREATLAVHDVSHGGLAVTLAEMVSAEAGAAVELETPASGAETLFYEQPGRVVIATEDSEEVRAAFANVAPVHTIGSANGTGELDVRVGEREVSMTATAIAERRAVLDRAME